jgi:hypothetical protein
VRGRLAREQTAGDPRAGIGGDRRLDVTHEASPCPQPVAGGRVRSGMQRDCAAVVRALVRDQPRALTRDEGRAAGADLRVAVVAEVHELRHEPHSEADDRERSHRDQCPPRANAQPRRLVEVRAPAVRAVLEAGRPLLPAERAGSGQLGGAVLGECLTHLLPRALARNLPWIRRRRHSCQTAT